MTDDNTPKSDEETAAPAETPEPEANAEAEAPAGVVGP